MESFLSFLAGAVILAVFGKMILGKKAGRSEGNSSDSGDGDSPFEDKGNYDLDDEDGDNGFDDAGDGGSTDD